MNATEANYLALLLAVLRKAHPFGVTLTEREIVEANAYVLAMAETRTPGTRHLVAQHMSNAMRQLAKESGTGVDVDAVADDIEIPPVESAKRH